MLKKKHTKKQEVDYEKYKEINLAEIGLEYKAVATKLWHFACYHLEDVPRKITLHKIMAQWFREWDTEMEEIDLSKKWRVQQHEGDFD